MKLKFTSFILVLTLLLSTLCVGCSQNTTDTGIAIPADMQAITSEGADYDLVVPAEWLVDTTVGMTSAYVEDMARSSVTVTANEISGEITTASEYWAMFTEEFNETFSDFTMLDEEPSDVTVGGLYEDESRHTPGLKYRYTATVGDTKYQWMQVLFLRGVTMYIITYTSTVDAYEDNIDDVNEIIGYFNFR